MLTKILDMSISNGYLIRIKKNNAEYFKAGPMGILLLNNLKMQWYNNTIINKDITMFPSSDDMHYTFDFAKKMCLDKIPFGITERVLPVATGSDDRDKKNVHAIDGNKKNGKTDAVTFNNYFDPEDQIMLKSTIFVPATTSVQFFHQLQRQRRVWWRKFSASPGRYRLTDIKNHSENKQSVEILADYSWGSQHLESIIVSNKTDKFPVRQLQFKESKKVIQAWIITSEVNVPTMFLNALCDCYDEPLFQEDKRQLLRLHRKLAPYRISFAVTGSSSAKISELSELALYLAKQLRANYISTLLLPSTSKFTLETQFRQYDQLGIPYTAVLNDKTLVDGILQLRSRDTTLKEQVHVTTLVSYVEKLFKND